MLLDAPQVDPVIARMRCSQTFHQSMMESMCAAHVRPWSVEDDLQDDICRDLFDSSEDDGDRLVDRDLEAQFFEEFCCLR